MEALNRLRILAERHHYSALREACMDADSDDPGVQLLLALADAHLGDASAARRSLASLGASLEHATLPLDARIDLAAVYVALGEFEAADAWVEQQRSVLSEDDWCALLSGLARRLAARDRHAQAEEWLRIGLRRYPEQLALYDQLARGDAAAGPYAPGDRAAERGPSTSRTRRTSPLRRCCSGCRPPRCSPIQRWPEKPPSERETKLAETDFTPRRRDR